MMDYLTQLQNTIIALGERHEVNPMLLGGLYFTSKVSMVCFLGWVIRNLRAKRAIMIPLLFACISFSLPYLYLVIAGRNLSIWVYVVIGLIFMYGAYSIQKKIRSKPVVGLAFIGVASQSLLDCNALL